MPHAKRFAASSDLFLRITERYEKPEWDIPEAQPEVVLEKPFCNLVRFKSKKKNARKVLVVAPLSGHHATLLRDTVRTLLAEHDVWITDWVNARLVPLTAGPFHLADYVDYVRDWIRFLSPDVHVISVCQPTVPVLAAVSLMAAKNEVQPRTMVMMGGPIDARRSPTAVNNLARHKPYSWFEQNVIQRVPSKYPGYMRRVYPGFLQHLGFVAMNPDRHLNAHWDYYHQLVAGRRRVRRRAPALLRRVQRGARHAGRVLPRHGQDGVPGLRAAEGPHVRCARSWCARRRSASTALLTIEGELDDISGNGQTEAAHALCLNIPRERRVHYVAAGVGHYGIFSGRRWREMIFPRVRDFIARTRIDRGQGHDSFLRTRTRVVALTPILQLVARAFGALTTRARR